jgi:hypothetical protein
MGEKHKLLSGGDKVTFESRGVGSGSLPDYTVRMVHTVRKSPRWNRLTLMESNVKLEQLHESRTIRRAKTGRLSGPIEVIRPYTEADGLAIEQTRAARRVLAALRHNDVRLLSLSTEELHTLADRLEAAEKSAG